MNFYLVLVSTLLGFCVAYPEQLSVEVKEPIVEDVPYEDVVIFGDGLRSVEEETEPQGRVSYAGDQLWKVEAENDKKIRVLLNLRNTKDISAWGGNLTFFDILVKTKSLNHVAHMFQENDIRYEVLIDDLQRAIDEENPPITDDVNGLEDRTGHRMTWIAYHSLSDIYDYLNYVSTSYPQLCNLATIGNSVEGRSLLVLKISNGNPANKAVWIDGGIHAREWISPATVTYIINYLLENFEKEPSEIQNVDWHILSVANPDGYEYTRTTDRLWRKNRSKVRGSCPGTDLNRNFGYKWGGKGSSKNPCQEIYSGASPFSEPETAAIKNYITGTYRHANWKAYLTFHSYGQYIIFPWGYDKLYTQDHNDLQTVGNKMAGKISASGGAAYRVGTSATLLYPAAGGSDDWAKSVGIKYTYTIELRDNGYYGFVLPAKFILPTAKEGLIAMKVIASTISKE